MSELTIKLIIILIPGAIATLIFGKLILHKEWSTFKFTLYSILFGVVSYLLLQILYNIINLITITNFGELTLWENLTNSTEIPYKEVIYASIISVIIAFFTSFIENRKLISAIAKKINVSNKYGDENLFSRYLNSSEVGYIYLRDIKNNLTYHGWVKSFSESDSLSEIVLGDVSVYSYKDSQLLYDVSQIYLSLNKHDIIIEFANLKEKES